jgi:hypothetical protein
LIIDIKIGPGGYGDEQGHTDRKNELGSQPASNIFNKFEHFSNFIRPADFSTNSSNGGINHR